MEIITSVNNEKVKRAASLNDKKFRRFYGSFLVEGQKLVSEVICGAGELIALYVASSAKDKYTQLISKCDPSKVYILSDAAFSKISNTETPQGIIAEVKMMPSLELDLSSPFLVLDNIQDPGNLGTIVRTAAAVGFENIIMLDCVDPYSPKVVRSSSGGIFYVNFFPVSYDELLDEVQKTSAKLFICDMNGENIFSFKKPSGVYGLVIGSEGRGISERLKRAASNVLSLPMKSQMESLNAAVSGSIIMYQLKKDEFV